MKSGPFRTEAEISPAAEESRRLKTCIRGAVQGVGFRPFIFRLASELNLAGWVSNSPQGVMVEVEGPRSELEQFLLRLEKERPPHSSIQSLEASWLDPLGHAGFEIRVSDTGGDKTAIVLPDIATCAECLREIFDPSNRRYLYPFTNCTHCGPRFSIIEALPYDRANTSMKAFAMCPQCRAEYNDPRDRRFHAQPNACPQCGPQLELWNPAGVALASRKEALVAAADALRAGRIVAVKGLGGFHLMVAAHDERAIQRLRELKHREEKPFALMFPSLEAVRRVCEVSHLEERLLRSPEAPIVLLHRCEHSQNSNPGVEIAHSVAPGNPRLGILLPYTPLHHLLMPLLGFPVVATSGNLSDEPICVDEREALGRLGPIADLFLVHNRPIVRHVDDSIVRVTLHRELVLRRARGYAPLPIALNAQLSALDSPPVLAVGGHLKNSVALSIGRQVFIGQHIGDLETRQAFEAFSRVIEDLQRLYEVQPGVVAADLHPDYLSTKFALEFVSERRSRTGHESAAPEAGAPKMVRVQHHVAHVLSCLAENELQPPVLGVSWDGTGYGPDGTIWGGEFFHVTESTCERVAHLRRFRLPGGDKAVKEPRRSALGVLYELFGEGAFEMRQLPPLREVWSNELATLKGMLEQGVNSPLTSSAGRLFDAVAALTGLRQRMRFEGQAAMELEFALEDQATEEAYPWPEDTAISPDWQLLIKGVVADVQAGVPKGIISARFHNALSELIVAVARQVGEESVALSGGCFQNRYLTERTVRRLRQEGFRPYWHQRVPPNDGGIALGQIVAALRERR